MVGVLAGATTRYVESVSYTEADQSKLTRLEGGVIGDVRVYDVERVAQLKSVTIQKCGNPAEASCSTGSSLREVLEFAVRRGPQSNPKCWGYCPGWTSCSRLG